MQSRLDQPFVRFTVTMVTIIAAFLLRQVLVLRTGLDLPPFITLYPAIAVVALFFGLWPGLLATALAALLVDFWVFPPIGTLAIKNPSQAVTLAFFFATGVFISVVTEGYRRFQRRSQEIAESRRADEALSRYRLLASHARDIVLFLRFEDGMILEANEAAAEAYGYTIEQLKRMTIHDLRETGTRPLAPSEMAELRSVTPGPDSSSGEDEIEAQINEDAEAAAPATTPIEGDSVIFGDEARANLAALPPLEDSGPPTQAWQAEPMTIFGQGGDKAAGAGLEPGSPLLGAPGPDWIA